MIYFEYDIKILSPLCKHGLGVDQLSGKTGPELPKGASFCDVSLAFIPILDGAN